MSVVQSAKINNHKYLASQIGDQIKVKDRLNTWEKKKKKFYCAIAPVPARAL